MEIDSTLTRKTYTKFVLVSALRSGVPYYLVGGILTVFLLGLFLKFKHLLNFTIIYGGVIAGLIILYYAIWLLYQCFFSKNRRWFFVKRHFSIRDEDIQVKFFTSEQKIKWEAYSNWSRTAGCYVLRCFNGNIYIIPVSDIPPWELSYFENLLRQKIDKIETINQTTED
jgi:hypothetical protein